MSQFPTLPPLLFGAPIRFPALVPRSLSSGLAAAAIFLQRSLNSRIRAALHPRPVAALAESPGSIVSRQGAAPERLRARPSGGRRPPAEIGFRGAHPFRRARSHDCPALAGLFFGWDPGRHAVSGRSSIALHRIDPPARGRQDQVSAHVRELWRGARTARTTPIGRT
jgi:hypothetical protein